MTLLARHIEFIEALRAAGLPVSLAEDLDAVHALTSLGLGDRETMRTAYAATLVKRQVHREPFDATFDLFFPPLLGAGVPLPAEEESWPDQDALLSEQVRGFRERLREALVADDQEQLRELAVEGVARFGAMPGRGPGLAAWSAYQAMQRIAPDELVERLAAGLAEGRLGEESARRTAQRRVAGFTRLVESDARRRVAEEKGPAHVARTTVRPSIDQIAFTAARKADVEQMRREIYPLARRLATRMSQEHHARRRGPLDFRRTVRASISTGGVPLTTHHKPKRPHRTELVVLCDVSGSVASFAQFTLMLVFALREQFNKVRAFTFVDDVHEVTGEFVPGADLADTMTRLAASAQHAALMGRTNYGRAFTRFTEQHPDALGPKSSLLVLGDARSNYSDLALPVLKDMVRSARHAWWLNPEHSRQWNTGDSAARPYGEVMPMVECRNLTQLGEFVHDIL